MVKNEWAKIFCRPSTRWIFLLAVLVSVCWFGWLRLSRGVQAGGYTLDLAAQIDYYESSRPEGFQAELARLHVLQDNDIDPYQPDWRADAADQVREAVQVILKLQQSWLPEDVRRMEELQESVEQDQGLIAANDWKGYYEKKLAEVRANSELSDEARENLTWQYQYALDNEVAAEGSEWKYQLYNRLLSAKKELAESKLQEEQGVGANREQIRLLAEQVEIACYRIENNKKVVVNESIANRTLLSGGLYTAAGIYGAGEGSPYWNALFSSGGLIKLWAAALAVIAAISVAGEYSSGAARLLPASPSGRKRTLLAKLTAIAGTAVLMTAAYWLVNALLAGVFNGFGDIFATSVYIVDGRPAEISGLLANVVPCLCALPGMLAYGMLAAALGALSHNVAAAAGLTSALLLAGDSVVSGLAYLEQDWARYTLFANVNLESIRQGTALFYGQSVWLALAVMGVHTALFILIAWDAAVRRDVP